MMGHLEVLGEYWSGHSEAEQHIQDGEGQRRTATPSPAGDAFSMTGARPRC